MAHKILVLLIVILAAVSQMGVMAEGFTTQPTHRPDVQSSQTGSEIIVGMEYILIKSDTRITQQAEALAPIGAFAAKPLAEHIEWGAMQSGPDAAIDFQLLDNFVREFQLVGFSELVLALKSHSPWASKDYALFAIRNPSPKPEYMDDYAAWITAIVERYDGDGQADMPDLQYPVRFYEIGSEFSSYEPEPVDDYLAMLEQAYQAAHATYADVIITHAAFLTTTAFKDKPTFDEYEAAFANVPARIQEHPLPDLRKVLDRPDLFDVVNIHSLGDSTEIEDMVTWLNYEMDQRGYLKRIIISDTTPTPLIAWGVATTCDLLPNQMGLIIPPAIEADRCRLASYFSKLLEGDEPTLHWTQSFVAEEMAKKVIVAAEQDVWLINTSFTEDLAWFKLEIWQAGAGTSAWGGMIDLDNAERRAGFYALKQLIGHVGGYDSIQRLPSDEGVRLYEVMRHGQRRWIAWYDPSTVTLPDDAIPSVTVEIAADHPQYIVETLITEFGQSTPSQTLINASDDVVTLNLSPTPIFIYSDQVSQPMIDVFIPVLSKNK